MCWENRTELGVKVLGEDTEGSNLTEVIRGSKQPSFLLEIRLNRGKIKELHILAFGNIDEIDKEKEVLQKEYKKLQGDKDLFTIIYVPYLIVPTVYSVGSIKETITDEKIYVKSCKDLLKYYTTGESE